MSSRELHKRLEAMESATTICPKCNYARMPTDTAPAWQCPKCQIAYHKYRSYLLRVQRLVSPPTAEDSAPPVVGDGSIWALVAANVLTLGVAWSQGWSLTPLIITYWAQSVVIGCVNVFRIVSLDKFSTDNIKRKPEPTAALKWQAAVGFALVYGMLHFAWWALIAANSTGPLIDDGFWICLVAFAVNHFWSYRYNRELDRQGAPRITTYIWLPFVRIAPIHVTMCLSVIIGTAGGVLLLFGALKTVADVVMHVFEHVRFRRARNLKRSE